MNLRRYLLYAISFVQMLLIIGHAPWLNPRIEAQEAADHAGVVVDRVGRSRAGGEVRRPGRARHVVHAAVPDGAGHGHELGADVGLGVGRSGDEQGAGRAEKEADLHDRYSNRRS